MPKIWQAIASELPHCPAPVSVAIRLTPSMLVVEGLRHGGVGFVAAGRADALVLVEDANPLGQIERLLEPVGAVERSRPPEPVDVAHLVRDRDPALLRDLLLDDLHREERSEISRTDRLERAGMKRRRQRRGEIGGDVVPVLGQIVFGQQVFGRYRT